MKNKLLLLILLVVSLQSKANVTDHQYLRIFANDTFIIESITLCNVGDKEAKDYLLQNEHSADTLVDGILFNLTPIRYFLYFPEIHTKFVVKSRTGKQNLGEHLLYILEKYRKNPQLFCNNN